MNPEQAIELYLNDIFNAQRLTEAHPTKDNLSKVVDLQCRYALIQASFQASLNSLTVAIPIELLVALVKHNFWTPEQTFAYTLQSSNPKIKAESLTAIIDYLPSGLKQQAIDEAIAAAREIGDAYFRADTLCALVDKRTELLPETLKSIKEIRDVLSRFFTLLTLAKKLPAEFLPQLLAFAKEIKIPDERFHADALGDLSQELPAELLPQLLASTRGIRSGECRASALSALADKMPELWPEALASIKEIGEEDVRANALHDLAEKLPASLLPEALATAREIKDKFCYAYVLSALVGKLPELLPESLAAIRKIKDDCRRAHIFSDLAGKLPSLLPEALAITRDIWDDCDRAYALSTLADKLPAELLPQALVTVKAIGDERERANALCALVDKLPVELLPQALAIAREIGDESKRLKLFLLLLSKTQHDGGISSNLQSGNSE
jgi:hypothetical protein